MSDLQAGASDAFTQPTLPLRSIRRGQNYRLNYDEGALADLQKQIEAVGGVLEPILVRQHPIEDDAWEIVAGERRSICARRLYGDDYKIPVRVVQASDAEARAMGIIENHGRDDPSLIEEAKGAADLLAINEGDRVATASQLGWSEQVLAARLLLLNCSPAVQRAIIDRHPRVKLGHAELLAGLEPSMQDKVLTMLIANSVPVPVSELKNQLSGYARQLSTAFFKTDVCVGCPHNSSSQSGLFDETLSAGNCMNPSHFEELTSKALEEAATPLRERYQVVKLVRPGDGFQPLVVTADGALGVGAEQFESCKGCAKFGCALSATPGSYGEVTEGLCFDAACNSKMVAARRTAERAASKKAGTDDAKKAGSAASTGQAKPAGANVRATAEKPKNYVPSKVVAYREAQWRRWLAVALMGAGQRNKRALIALVLARKTSAIQFDKYVEAARKLTGVKVSNTETQLRKALDGVDTVTEEHVDSLVAAVVAAGAYGIDNDGLEALLNYLAVDEAANFTLGSEYLELLTVSELESLAGEVGLKAAMGSEMLARAKAGKRADFIKALLSVKGFTYAGAVPKAMRYPRRKAKQVERDAPAGGGPVVDDGGQADATAAVVGSHRARSEDSTTDRSALR